MPVSPFDFVNAAKRGSTNIEGYAYFTVMSLMSSSKRLLPIANMMNKLSFSRLPNEIQASLVNEIIRKYSKEYLTYPKQAKLVHDKNNLDYQIVSQILKCSILEAKLYIERGYITDKDIKKMKENL